MEINKTKRSPGRPRKFNNLTQINGKVESPKDISQFSTLEECWGAVNPLSAYGTVSEADYEAQLRNMTNSELENHARQKGVMFTKDAQEPYKRLRGLLLKEFRAYVSSLNKPSHQPVVGVAKESLEANVKNILKDVR